MVEAAGEHHKEHTMTKAELVEEVTRVTELPRKESEAVVETIFESIISALQSDDKIEIRGFGSAAAARGAIPRPVRKWKSLRKKFPSSSPARN
jgi:nucleoid DNA-binding protein